MQMLMTVAVLKMVLELQDNKSTKQQKDQSDNEK